MECSQGQGCENRKELASKSAKDQERIMKTREKAACVRRKYGPKVTPSKFQSVMEEFSDTDYENFDTDSSDSDVESGSDISGVHEIAEEEAISAEVREASEVRSARGIARSGARESNASVDNEITYAEEEEEDDISAEGRPTSPEIRSTRGSIRSRARGRHARYVRSVHVDDCEWSTDNSAPFFQLFTGTPGLTIPCPNNPLEFIQLFIKRDLLEFFSYVTNLYAEQSLRNAVTQIRNEWYAVNVKELAQFLGITMMMGILRAPKMSMYWQVGKKWHVPAISTCMSSRRYFQIAKYFHSYNNKAIPDENSDRLIKVRTVMEYLTQKYKTYYIPDKHVSLDEGSMAWRGRLSFKVYNPNKPDKYGVKLYMVAEAKTGYVFDFEVYSGTGRATIETVMNLMAPLRNKGYHLYMDNYYNSVALSEQLLEEGVYTCGTLRMQRGAPKDLQMQAKKKMASDVTVFRRKGNVFIILWRDKRVVSVITTCHNADTQKVERKKKVRKADGQTSINRTFVNKPKAVCDYNDHMKGVDHFDQMVKYYHFTRKCQKWTKKLTFYFLQMALHNAHVLYKKYTRDEKPLKLLDFHEILIDALMDFEGDQWPIRDDNIPHAPDIGHDTRNEDEGMASPGTGVRQSLCGTESQHDASSHTEDVVETTPTGAKGRKPRIMDPPTRLNKNLNHAIIRGNKYQRCRVCYRNGKRKDTKLLCKSCNMPMCAVECYGLYHRKVKYWQGKK